MAECMEWAGSRLSSGYGTVTVNGRTVMAHRVAYETHVGPIPEGLEIDHLCHNRGCVNPDHLEPVTHRENIRRMLGLFGQRARADACQRGHAYADHGTVDVDGRRRCRTCRQDARQRRAA